MIGLNESFQRYEYIDCQMGNNSKSEEKANLMRPYKSEDWLKVDDLGSYEIWMEKATNCKFDVYLVETSLLDDHSQLEAYAFRKMHSNNFVSIESILIPDQKFICSHSHNSYLLVQNITHRLASLHHGQLTFQEALTVLSSACSSYNILNSFYGPLQPTPEMICFNSQGQTKIWLNQNLSSNKPSFKTQCIQSQNLDDRQSMSHQNVAEYRAKQCVGKLFEIINEKCNKFPASFVCSMYKMNTYFQAENLIESYCQENNIRISATIDLQKLVMYKIQENAIMQSNQLHMHGNNMQYYHLQSNSMQNNLVQSNSNRCLQNQRNFGIKFPNQHPSANEIRKVQGNGYLQNQHIHQSYQINPNIQVWPNHSNSSNVSHLRSLPKVREPLMTKQMAQNQNRNQKPYSFTIKPNQNFISFINSSRTSYSHPILPQKLPTTVYSQPQIIEDIVISKQHQILTQRSNVQNSFKQETKYVCSNQGNQDLLPNIIQENYQIEQKDLEIIKYSKEHQKEEVLRQKQSEDLDEGGKLSQNFKEKWQENMVAIGSPKSSPSPKHKRNSSYSEQQKYLSEEYDVVHLLEINNKNIPAYQHQEEHEGHVHDLAQYTTTEELEKHIRQKYSEYLQHSSQDYQADQFKIINTNPSNGRCKDTFEVENISSKFPFSSYSDEIQHYTSNNNSYNTSKKPSTTIIKENIEPQEYLYPSMTYKIVNPSGYRSEFQIDAYLSSGYNSSRESKTMIKNQIKLGQFHSILDQQDQNLYQKKLKKKAIKGKPGDKIYQKYQKYVVQNKHQFNKNKSEGKAHVTTLKHDYKTKHAYEKVVQSKLMRGENMQQNGMESNGNNKKENENKNLSSFFKQTDLSFLEPSINYDSFNRKEFLDESKQKNYHEESHGAITYDALRKMLWQ